MSKQHRTKLIKSLEQQLEATTDPKIKADISRQLTKLLSKPTRKGSSRKPEATSQSKKTGSLRDIYTTWPYREMSLSKIVVNHGVLQWEKKGRELKRKLTQTEKEAVFAEVMASLSAEDRAALEAESSNGGEV